MIKPRTVTIGLRNYYAVDTVNSMLKFVKNAVIKDSMKTEEAKIIGNLPLINLIEISIN